MRCADRGAGRNRSVTRIDRSLSFGRVDATFSAKRSVSVSGLTPAPMRSGVISSRHNLTEGLPMPSDSTTPRRARPMNIVLRRGSSAEHKYSSIAGIPDLLPEELAPGVPPTPAHDLLYHGGKTIPNLTFTNFYVAGDAWQASDIQNIDRALAAAMTEPTLNNVMAQYFTGVPTSKFVASQNLPGPVPAHISQATSSSSSATFTPRASWPPSTSAPRSSTSCCRAGPC